MQVPEVPGLFTQVRRLDDVVDAVRDALGLFRRDADARIDLRIALSLEAAELVGAVVGSRAPLDRAKATHEAAVRRAAGALAREGYSPRDAAELLGYPPERLAELLGLVAQSPRRSRAGRAPR